MRTTVDIPDETYRKLKVKAALEGEAVRQIVLRGILREIEQSVAKPARRLTEPILNPTHLARFGSTMNRSTTSSVFPDVNVWLALTRRTTSILQSLGIGIWRCRTKVFSHSPGLLSLVCCGC